MSEESIARTSHFALHQWQPADKKNSLDSELCKRSSLFIDGVLMLGALTPKRWAKHAVTRNLIRRQIHSVSREFEKAIAPTAYVVRLRATFQPQKFVSASSDLLRQTVREELKQLFGKVSLT